MNRMMNENMKTPKEKLPYPENLYYDVFGGISQMPSGAENLLKYVLENLFPEDVDEKYSEILMRIYRDKMTFQEIAEGSDNLTKDEIQKNIDKLLRALRHPKRSRVLAGLLKPEK